MKAFAAATVAATLACAALTQTSPVQADERFCNQTPYPAEVIEGHQTAGKGLTVKGTTRVRPGTCATIVPGRLTQRRYYVRVTVHGESYGQDENRLCYFSMRHFTIEAEDAPGFKCSGGALPSNVHMKGFDNAPERLGSFTLFRTNGEANLIVTQRRDLTFHFELQ